MTPPMQHFMEGSRSNTHGSRRVEFSGLSTIDSEAPQENNNHHWDSETDHLLSFFLGPDQGGHSNHNAFQDFASAPSRSNHPLMHSGYGGGLPASSTTSSSSTLAEEPMAPRTPAMQFYHPGHSHSSSAQGHHHSSSSSQGHSYARQTAENIAAMQSQNQLISSSSSSSLSSMAAALVSGGPVLRHHVHHGGRNQNHGNVSRDSPHIHGEDSPISPAAMIGGSGHENLMLPPPSRVRTHGGADHGPAYHHSPAPAPRPSPSAKGGHQQQQDPQYKAAAAAHRQQQQQQQQRQDSMIYPTQITSVDPSNKEDHINWLKELNARAKAANQPSTTNGNPASQPQPTNQPSMAAMPPNMGGTMQHQQQPPAIVPPSPSVVGPHHIFAPHATGSYPAAAAAAAAAAVAQNPMLYHAAMNHKFHMAAQSQGESEEKRARRLERNRESARKSRRRKKERLATLGAQVDKLHTLIEEEREKQVDVMCSQLKQARRDELAKFQKDSVEQSETFQEGENAKDRLATIVKSTSCGSQIAQATIEFQYNTLKQVLLPRYQKFLLWLTLHEESFFSAGKDEYSKKEGKQVLRVSSGRVSSKQIGDELTNGWKTEKVDKKNPRSKADTPDIGERSNPTSRALDAPRMWPLLCFELFISVDQEERLMQALKRIQQTENLAEHRSQLAAATKMTQSLREAIASQCRAAAAREDKCLLEVLTPTQTAKFHDWVATNQDRGQRIIDKRRADPGKNSVAWKEASLFELGRRLEEVLRISKKEGEEEDEEIRDAEEEGGS